MFIIKLDSDDIDEKEEARETDDNESYDRKRRAKKLEKLLKKKLTEFLDSSVLYSLRRVLPAELNTVYVKQFENSSGDNKLENEGLVTSDFIKAIGGLKNSGEECEVNEVKGGFRITSYLNYHW